MMLRIGKNTKPAPYTSREIMEDEQQELWFQATESVKKLTEVQKRVVELLPKCRKILSLNLLWKTISDYVLFLLFLKRFVKS